MLDKLSKKLFDAAVEGDKTLERYG
jgi:hypothetical protein